MSWMPPAAYYPYCTTHSTFTSCQPSSLMFLYLITNLFGHSGNRNNYIEENIYEDESYDFVIVGAGSAGCVLANRLTENIHWNVLLLEAGSDEPAIASIPAFAPFLEDSSIDWDYNIQPQQEACRVRPNQRCEWNRGRVMGGSSAINDMIYIRGNREDYDNWERLGNPGWNYNEMLYYFKKAEGNTNLKLVRENPGYHNTDGPQPVSNFPYLDINAALLIKAFEEFGYPRVDVNGERQIGVMESQSTARNGERMSTNRAYIDPIRNVRRNLAIKTEARVTRIIFDYVTRSAIGVEFMQHGILKKVFAKKEVILSAGSIDSQRILKISGIGPKEELESLGIKVLVDSAVGFNLQDHVTTLGVMATVSNKTSTLKSLEGMKKDLQYYVNWRDGPLSSNGVFRCAAFVQTKYATSINAPDMNYAFDNGNIEDFIRDPWNYPDYSAYPSSYYNAITIRPLLLSQKSKGYILLNRTDPTFGEPLIFANYFKEPQDKRTLIEGIKLIVRIFDTDILRRHGIQMYTKPFYPCEHFRFNSDPYWDCIISSYTNTGYHPVGTCKMGPRTDYEAVVDPRLRVYGVKNLRVIDSSIMPLLIKGNTNAPTIAIAEKGSDLVKEDWSKSYYH